ncbi:MAG: hypothetical protein L0196_05025 [candidate division Zixibacteria bacterium]|nr:hypothetical protein [candidate division Zixibacteria bacterium]
MTNSLQYVKNTKIWLKDHPEFDENWLQGIIENDPSILGLGDIVLKESQRVQPKAGRLDLLFQDAEEDKRFEVEIMLGKVDESHIIRCLEYWDMEKKRFPNYDHCAVLVAEDITSRFLNVISLLNRTVPLIVLQMNALQIENKVTLHFTKVLDEFEPGTDEDEERLSEREIADRAYWEKRGTATTMGMADECLKILKEISSSLTFKYNKYYIGLVDNNRVNNFIQLRPKKKYLDVGIRIADLESLKESATKEGIETTHDKRWGYIYLTLYEGEVPTYKDFLKGVFDEAYKESIT